MEAALLVEVAQGGASVLENSWAVQVPGENALDLSLLNGDESP